MSSREFVGERSCIAEARRFVRTTLEAADQGSACDTAMLLTSELATNVVGHAATSFEVVIDINDEIIRVEVHDGMAVSDAFRDLVEHPPTAVDAIQTNGRGIMLIGLTAVRFGLQDKGTDGKAVWFELAAADSAS